MAPELQAGIITGVARTGIPAATVGRSRGRPYYQCLTLHSRIMPMRFRYLPFLLLLLGILALAGCRMGNPYYPVPKELAQVLKLYEDVVRWSDLNKIYAFGKKGAGWEVPPGLDNVRVNGYETSDPAELEPWRWGQTAVISYVLNDRQVVKQVVDQQVWVSEDEGESWYRENPPPPF